MTAGFWDRVADRVRPTETLKTIEDPRMIVRAFTLASWVAVGQIIFSAGAWALSGETTVAWMALGTATSFAVGWTVFAWTGHVFGAVVFVFSAGTTFLALMHVVLGGYAYSGGILLFGITYVSLTALLLGRRMAMAGAAVYAVLGIVLGIFEHSLRSGRQAPSVTLTTVTFVAVLVGSINVATPVIVFFMDRLRLERARAERLLLNVLPPQVAKELKEHGSTTARRFDSISVLFADIVGFTPMSATMSPEELVERLGEVFTFFDTLADRYGVEKIRTIGDGYMVAAGVPLPRDDHAEVLARMALDIVSYSRSDAMTFRIGINSGPAVAGVIGTRKFQYDIWGDTVNTASRMESHGEPGRIHITESTNRLIEHRFTTIPRGLVEVKGKGPLATWWLEGERGAAAAS